MHRGKQGALSRTNKWLVNILLLSLMPLAHAEEVVTVEQALLKCRNTYPGEFEAKKRLACFDSISTPAIESKELAKEQSLPAASGGVELSETSQKQLDDELAQDNAGKKDSKPAIAVKKKNTSLSYLERKWRLTSEGDWDITDIETYQPNYLLITNSDSPNNIPTTPNHSNTDDRDLSRQDVKFQLSIKSELMHNIQLIRDLPYVTSSRLWGAYTQQSYWQIFNRGDSRPLRENDYQPEIILSLGIDNEHDGVRQKYIPRMVNLGLTHQSNGQSDPLSRSWNRVYLEGGWELTDRLTLAVRPWWRVPERSSRDDNPDIEKYMGYGDMTLRWETGSRRTAVSMLLRNNLRSDNKGFAQLDLQQRIFNNPYIKLHFMLSTGYGETLLDYNHSQNVVGFGISLGE